MSAPARPAPVPALAADAAKRQEREPACARAALSDRRQDLSSQAPTAVAGTTGADRGGDPGFAARVIDWQRRHGRHDLPWQSPRDPYRVWVSEIMLQQTQVATAIPYFRRFIARFPDLPALATAELDSVLREWAGLGYYARARHLHAAARTVAAHHGGRLPDSLPALTGLPGIGRSTAGAILALGFGRPAAILDGNVRRLLARCFAVTGKPQANEARLWQLAGELLPADDPIAYTQGLMDLGATVCTRNGPACARCPLADRCLALRDGLVESLPEPRRRLPLPSRTRVLLLLEHDGRLLFERRPPAGIWGGLLSLPEAEPGEVDAALAALPVAAQGAPVELGERRHAFTHFRLRLLPRVLAVRPLAVAEGRHCWLFAGEAIAAGVPAPVARILRAS
jgi:A/G-specific adenine glycosylase